MPKVYVYFGGRISARIISKMTANDLLLWCDEKPSSYIKCESVQVAKDKCPDEDFHLASSMADLLRNINYLSSYPYESCFLNGLWNFSIKPPLETAMAFVKDLKNRKVENVEIIAPEFGCDITPLVGFVTPESRLGSKSVMPAYAAHIFIELWGKECVVFRKAANDIWGNRYSRKAILKTLNIAFAFLFLSKLVFVCLFSFLTSSRETQEKPLFIVRTQHHLRFFKALSRAAVDKDIGVMVAPQITKFSFRGYYGLVKESMDSGYLVAPTLREIVKAIVWTLKDLSAVKKRARSSACVKIKTSCGSFYFNAASISAELPLISVLLLYKNILSMLLGRGEFRSLITFEMVSRMAGLESMAARECGVKSHAIQSALVSPVPHLVFPYSDFFYTDSPAFIDLYKKIGCIKMGDVVSEGGPYKTVSVVNVKKIEKIVFFSQPYENEITKEILKCILVWAKAQYASVVLRLHPRDSESAYSDLLNGFSDVLSLSQNKNVVDDILLADITLTRTSSVAKEALAYGKPVVLCTFTGFDKSVIADYIDQKDGCVANDLSELSFLLSNFDDVISRNQRLHEKLFMGKDVYTLSKVLLQ